MKSVWKAETQNRKVEKSGETRRFCIGQTRPGNPTDERAAKRGVPVQKSDRGGLTAWQLVMLALGTAVGGSFFLGTAVVLRSSGPASIIGFVVGGFLVYLILSALSELTVARPAHGSFREYAETAFGPMASFVVGWLYWSGLVLALSSESVAAALFARRWLPATPIWILSLGVILGVAALNLLAVKLFSAIESAMAAVKLLAIAAFILLMGAAVLGLLPASPPIGMGALRGEPFLPAGWGGLAGSMLLILFAYAGFETLGLAAPDAREPARTVPRAVILTAVAMVVLYIGAVAVLLPVLPIGEVSAEVSPLIAALERSRFPGLAPALNLVILSASLSTMLAATYGLGRMLYSLAEEGQAPALFKQRTPAGTPRNAILASAAGMLVGTALAYLLPKQVYLFLVSSGGFVLLFSYLMILASQLVIRRREGCPRAGCQMPGYPFTTWLGIILLIASMAAMVLVPGQGAGLVTGLILLAAFAVAYWVWKRPLRQPDPEPEEELRERVPLG
jgi:AAT family amino acid transporter